jgi:hypothetical protein
MEVAHLFRPRKSVNSVFGSLTVVFGCCLGHTKSCSSPRAGKMSEYLLESWRAKIPSMIIERPGKDELGTYIVIGRNPKITSRADLIREGVIFRPDAKVLYHVVDDERVSEVHLVLRVFRKFMWVYDMSTNGTSYVEHPPSPDSVDDDELVACDPRRFVQVFDGSVILLTHPHCRDDVASVPCFKVRGKSFTPEQNDKPSKPKK